MVMEDEPAEARRAAGPTQDHSRPRLAEAIQRVATVSGVVFYLRGHDHRMLGRSRADQLDGDMACVEKADRAIEHVESESLRAIGGLCVVVHPKFAGDERGDGRFADELVAVDARVDDHTELRRVDSTLVEAGRGGVHRELHRTPRRGRAGRDGANAGDAHAGRRWWLRWTAARRQAAVANGSPT